MGTFAWAIHQANITQGLDVISVADGLQINVDGANQTSSPFNLATISDSVTILGNNARLVGNPEFVTSGGIDVTKNNPQKFINGFDILATPSFSLLKIGTFNANNSGINVSISNLNTNGLNRIAQVNQGASLRYSGSAFEQSVNFTGGSTGCCFSGYAGSTISLDNVLIRDAHTFNSPIGLAFDALISAEDATLNISNSRIERSAGGGAISLVGGVANVVSSVLFGSGGVSAVGSASAGTLKFVNSLAYLTGPQENGGLDDDVRSNRFIAGSGGVIDVIASTILSDNATILGNLDRGYNNGVPLTLAGGSIQLSSSAVMATQVAGLDDQIAYAVTTDGGNYSADALSWVRPTGTQGASSLQTLFNQPGLLTGQPGIPVAVASVDPLVEFLLPYPEGAYPAVPGVLLGVVPDAGPGGVNELLNPMDGNPITTDVFGNPRTTNGLRNVGAVQAQVPGPLPLLGLASAYGWCHRLRRRTRALSTPRRGKIED